MKKSLIIPMALTLSWGANSYAQEMEAPVTKDVSFEKESDEKVEFGWAFNQELSLGANILSNQNVSGQDNGQSKIYSLKYSLSAEEIQEYSEWISQVNINESISRTPAIDRYIKSSDEFNINSVYKHFFKSYPKLGGFVSAQLNAPILEGYAETATPIDYLVVDKNGKSESITTDQLKLTDSFSPLTLKESLGLVAKLSNKKSATFEMRTGLGARQIFADGQYEVADDDATPETDVLTRENIQIIGFELLAELKGELLEKKLTYNIYSEALMPISYSPSIDDAPENSKLVSTETGAKLNYAITDWVSFTYDFKSKKEPLVKPKSEITHSFLLTASLKNSF